VNGDTLPRLLAGVPTNAPVTFAEHLDIHGPLPAVAHRHGRHAIIDEIDRAGLRGRGGAAFPTATKLRTVGAHRRPMVVVNGTEGEPTSAKDRLLLGRAPHLVLDGAITAAAAIGANEIYLCVDERARRARSALLHAIDERQFELPRRLQIHTASLPEGYVSGQESAVVSFLNGGAAKPTTSPVFERGVSGRATLVDNAETLAHVALIARHGAEWFRGLGTPELPGSTLVTITGAVAEGGVYEIEPGITVGALVESAGGVAEPVRALLFGGYAGTWLPAAGSRDLAVSPEGLAGVGAGLGAGLIHALPRSACPVAEIASVATWMSDESAQQCGPCLFGLAAIAEALTAIVTGYASAEAARQIDRWCSMVTRRGACAHPDGAARFAASGLRVFEREFAEHVVAGPCEACARPPVLPVPRHAQPAAAA
jgi:NADH:ubiquinone oxidoreductase subunit F (NADH-binding)